MITKLFKEYNRNKKRMIHIIFGDIIADMVSNKNLYNSNWTIHHRKKTKNCSCFMLHNLVCCTRIATLNSTHCFIMKIQNKWELHQISFNLSSGIDFKTLWIFRKNILYTSILL